AAQSKVVARKIEQTEVEIGFIENVNGLIQRYTELQREALDGARTESDPVRQKAFEERAALCRAVAEGALEKKQEVKPIPPRTVARRPRASSCPARCDPASRARAPPPAPAVAPPRCPGATAPAPAPPIPASRARSPDRARGRRRAGGAGSTRSSVPAAARS